MDPLTAVVVLSIAGAAAAVAMLQTDQDSIESISVPIETLTAGDFPPVCCKTGKPAEANIAVAQRRRFRTIVEGTVPVTKARLLEFTGWRDLYRRAMVALIPIAVVGLAIRLAADIVFVSWAVDIAILAVLFLAVFARAKARRLLVSPRRNLDGTVSLRALHPAFVAAVRAGAT